MLPSKIRKHRFEIMVNESREALSNPVVLAKLNDVDYRIAENTLGQPIGFIGDRELIVKIGSIAQKTARDAGIQSKLDNYDLSRFMDVVKMYYKDLTVEEVSNAFELCIVGELDYWLPKDRHGNPDKNHYQVFSLEYITKVLNAYKKKRTEILSRAVTMLPEKTQTLSAEEIKEIDNSVRREVREKFVKYRDEKIKPLFYVPIAVFLILRDVKVISTLQFETTKESYEKAMMQFINAEERNRRKAAAEYKEFGRISEILHNRAATLEADKKIIQIFDKMIEDEVNIDKLLEIDKK